LILVLFRCLDLFPLYSLQLPKSLWTPLTSPPNPPNLNSDFPCGNI
jgi:hypothetical protein